MKLNIHYLIGLALCHVVLCVACEDTTKTETPSERVAIPSAAPTPTVEYTRYESLPVERAKFMFENVDYIDYVFYELPFSLSVNTKNDIQNTIRQISSTGVAKIPACQPIGRLFFQVSGENVEQADFFFDDANKCYYFLFVGEDGKYQYGNLMTDAAAGYYRRLFNNVKTTG